MKNNALDLTHLGEQPLSLIVESQLRCESFIARMYCDFENVTEARYRLFATKSVEKEAQLPPSRNALKYHIQRAGYQVMIWKNAIKPMIDVPSPKGNGWDDSYQPILCDNSPTLNETVCCGCKKSMCVKESCCCLKSGMCCTDACTCQNCENRVTEEIQQLSEDEESSEEI